MLKQIAQKLIVANKFDYSITEENVKPTILKSVKDNKQIIYGAKALNAQIPFYYRRYTRDYDIYTSRSPERSARLLEKALDKIRGANYHYVKPAKHKGTFKVKDIGYDLKKDTEDDFTVADFTKKPKKLSTIRKYGFLFATLSEIKKSKLQSLRNPKYKYRHEKDRQDLGVIKEIERRKAKGFFR